MPQGNPPFEIIFTDINEIGMGSPYNTCNIELKGTHIRLPQASWQDKYAWAGDSGTLVLIKWASHEPAFQFFIIDTNSGQIQESKKINGCLKTIETTGNKIKYSKFLFDKEKSAAGKLCCETDWEYEII